MQGRPLPWEGPAASPWSLAVVPSPVDSSRAQGVSQPPGPRLQELRCTVLGRQEHLGLRAGPQQLPRVPVQTALSGCTQAG